MKKTIKILMLTMLLIALLVPMVKATTQSELEEYLLATHKVNGKDVSLSDEIKGKVKNFFKNNTLTDDQCTKIKAKIDEALALMEKAKVTDPAKLSSGDKENLIKIGQAAASIANCKLVVDTANDTIEIYKDGVLIDSASTNPGKLVQTGTTHYSYVIVPSVAIIAVAVAFVIRKKK